MGNPPLLLCDSDALVQFFLVDEILPLKALKNDYGIQPTIVEEVEIELRWMRKFKDKFVPQLDKALRSSILRVLDQTLFQTLLSGAPVGTSWAGFQKLGAQYNGYVQRGEAYTFAAGATLNLPAMSNDRSAIRVLEANMMTLPSPVLRAFDLVAFSLSAGILDLKACEALRSELLKNAEGLPRPFANASFENGVKSFQARLVKGTPTTASQGSGYASVLAITGA